MSRCCRKSSRLRAANSARNSSAQRLILPSGPLAARGRFVRPKPHLIPASGSCHEHSPARFRRPRTRSRMEDRRLPAADQTVVRAGQCRHRAGSRMRGARYRRPCRGDRVLQAQRGRSRRGRPGDAAGRRHRRRSRERRHQGVRAGQAGGAARGLQGIYQGALHRIQHSDRRLWPLHHGRRRAGLCARAGRADRGQGRRAGRRQGRRRRQDACARPKPPSP